MIVACLFAKSALPGVFRDIPDSCAPNRVSGSGVLDALLLDDIWNDLGLCRQFSFSEAGLEPQICPSPVP